MDYRDLMLKETAGNLKQNHTNDKRKDAIQCSNAISNSRSKWRTECNAQALKTYTIYPGTMHQFVKMVQHC